MIVVFAAIVSIAAFFWTLNVRAKDVPEPIPVSPIQHLEDRKQAIYENLRDLQFEYRVGKLSDQDYQQTKLDLQKELAGVLAEIDRLKQMLAQPVAPQKAAKKGPQKFVCPSCKAEFPTALKFCGECGKPMQAAQA